MLTVCMAFLLPVLLMVVIVLILIYKRKFIYHLPSFLHLYLIIPLAESCREQGGRQVRFPDLRCQDGVSSRRRWLVSSR